jgi:hypothetical protein
MNITDLGNIIRQIVKEEVTHTIKETNVSNKLTLTSADLAEIRKSIMIRYEKLAKIENIISIFNSHLENNTVPVAMNFLNFPKPLWVDDKMFIDEHNEIIRQTQKKMIRAIIDRGEKLVDSLNVELQEYKSKLDLAYDGNTERFMENIRASVNDNLKELLEARSQKKIIDEQQMNRVLENSPEEYINNYLNLNKQQSTETIKRVSIQVTRYNNKPIGRLSTSKKQIQYKNNFLIKKNELKENRNQSSNVHLKFNKINKHS